MDGESNTSDLREPVDAPINQTDILDGLVQDFEQNTSHDLVDLPNETSLNQSMFTADPQQESAEGESVDSELEQEDEQIDVDQHAGLCAGRRLRHRVEGGGAAGTVGNFADQVNADDGEDAGDHEQGDAAVHAGLAEGAREAQDA